MPRTQATQTQAVKAKNRKTEQWKQVKQTLRKQFQLQALRPGQEEIIRSVLEGQNTLAIMPTGAGKSLCYQLPALHLEGTTVVISPLISLMKDQMQKVEGMGIAAVELNSTVNAAGVRESIEKVSNEETEIIYVTPERFAQPEFIQSLHGTKIDFVVIDEAHCVSQWGHDFRPAYLKIRETLKTLKNPPVLALTATATEEVALDIQNQLGFQQMTVFRTSVFRENLQLEAQVFAKPDEKMQALLALVQEMKDSSGIIYTATVKAAQEIHDFLLEHGVASLLYHGKLKASEREQNQNEFMNNSPRLMVATNAFGMGVDKPDIRFVVHFQFPGSLEAYYQEAGRAGRDGERSRCILLYLKRDKSTQALFLSGKYPTPEEVVQVYQTVELANQKQTALTSAQLTEHLGEAISEKKVLVILALLKEEKILKESKKNGLTLMKKTLSSEQVIEIAKVYQERKERDQQKLSEMIRYAQSALCRWRSLRQFFHEETESALCQSCDNCLNPNRRALNEQVLAANMN